MEPSPDTPDPLTPPPAEPLSGDELPILLRPVPRRDWPNAITTVSVLTWVQVALVMICGNCSFGWALLAAFAWVADYFDLAVDPFGFGVLTAWAVGFAAISTYAYFVQRWSARADRRARITILIGTAVLAGCTAGAVLGVGAVPLDNIKLILLAAAPSLLIQAIVLRCAYGPEGRRWFNGSKADGMDRSA